MFEALDRRSTKANRDTLSCDSWLWVVNTRTTIPVGIRLRAQRILSLRGSFEKRRRLWISFCWITLLLAGEEPTHWVEVLAPPSLTNAIIDIIYCFMPQLLVRDLEPAIVRKLRSKAASLGISVEEAHRRLLREALFGDTPGPKDNFIAYLRSVPPGDDIEFTRAPDVPRPADL